MTGTTVAASIEFHAPPQAETIPDNTQDPSAWAQRCIVHRYHAPIPRYLEHHHVVPRAWQGLWQPPAISATGLWHTETVPLCRTGHGNVHYWIERIMQHYSADAGIHAAVAAAVEGQQSVGRYEHVVARRALEEWEAAGGSLSLLVDKHSWGGLYGGNAAE